MILWYLGALVYRCAVAARYNSTVYVIRLQLVCRQEYDKGQRLRNRRPPRRGGSLHLHCQPLALLLLAPCLCLLLHVLCARLGLG